MRESIGETIRWQIGAGLIFVAASSWADAQVLFDSDSGDYIGQGQHVTYSSGVTASRQGGNVTVTTPGQSTGFSLNFAMPNNVSGFVVGNYGNAERAAFRSPLRPGIDIYGDGRGCNTIAGWFRVLQAQFDGSGNPQQLAIDFKQNCEGGPAALYGAVRINSTLPLDDNGPFAIAGPSAEAIEGAAVTLNGNQSFERDGAQLSYQWLQQSGPPVQLVGSTSAAPSFTAPRGVPLGGSVLVFQLRVTSSLGSDTDTVRINVHSKSDRQNYIDFTSQNGDYIGGGLNYHFDSSNTQFTYNINQAGAHIGLQSDASWNIDMVPASGSPFGVGAYEGAQRWPFQAAGSPGLSIYGDGRGCNTVTGRFDVTQEQADSSGNVLAFGADFEQHCEGATPALLGTIRHNYLDPHVPTALAGPSQSATAGQTVMLDGSGSTDPMGTLTAYQWMQTQGPAVTLNSANTAKPSFVAPAVTSPQSLVFTLLVTDNLGYMATAATQVADTPASSSSSGGGSSSSSSSGSSSSSSSSSSSGSSSRSSSGSGGGGAFGWQVLAVLGLLAALRLSSGKLARAGGRNRRLRNLLRLSACTPSSG